jgi:hypothetical protein
MTVTFGQTVLGNMGLCARQSEPLSCIGSLAERVDSANLMPILAK